MKTAERNILVVNRDQHEAQTLSEELAKANASWRTGWATEFSSVEQRLNDGCVQALISDGPVPGMSQEEFLQNAARICPSAFRLSLSGDYDDGVMLRTMGYAHQNLWKPCRSAEVWTTLARAFALRDALRNDHLQLLIAKIDSLPSLPRLYLEFLEEARKRSPSIERLNEIIRQDIGLCSKMLQLVNSAFFGLPHPITSPGDALLYLGLESVRALILSIHVFSLFDESKIKELSIGHLWEHSWKVGAVARRIAIFERRPADEIETAFTAGLLHDVGKLVLASGASRSWKQAIEDSSRNKIELWKAERESLVATHAEVGAALLGMWGLSDEIIEAVAFHHEPETSGCTSFTPLAAVHGANELVNRGTAANPSPYLEQIDAADNFKFWQELARKSAD